MDRKSMQKLAADLGEAGALLTKVSAYAMSPHLSEGYDSLEARENHDNISQSLSIIAQSAKEVSDGIASQAEQFEPRHRA